MMQQQQIDNNNVEQEAQLSQKSGCTMLLMNILLTHSSLFETTPFDKSHTSSY